MKRLFLSAAIAACLPTMAMANSETSTLDVSLNNIASVEVSTVAINFGDVAASVTNPTGTGAIVVNATDGLAYNIAIDAGLNSTGIGVCRSMNNVGPGSRRYRLFSDFTYSTGWGDADFGDTCAGTTDGSANSKAAVGDGTDQIHSVYAEAFIGSSVGLMTDTLTVTIHY